MNDIGLAIVASIGFVLVVATILIPSQYQYKSVKLDIILDTIVAVICLGVILYAVIVALTKGINI